MPKNNYRPPIKDIFVDLDGTVYNFINRDTEEMLAAMQDYFRITMNPSALSLVTDIRLDRYFDGTEADLEKRGFKKPVYLKHFNIEGFLDKTIDEMLNSFEYYGFILKPYKSMLRTLRELSERKSVNMYVLSAYLTPEAKEGKRHAVQRDMSRIVEPENILLVPYGTNKAEYVKGILGHDLNRHTILIDDHSKNCQEWHDAGGRAIKVLNGGNGAGIKWQGEKMKLDGTLIPAKKAICSDFDAMEILVTRIYRQAAKDWLAAKKGKTDDGVKPSLMLDDTESFFRSGQYNIDGNVILEMLRKNPDMVIADT